MLSPWQWRFSRAALRFISRISPSADNAQSPLQWVRQHNVNKGRRRRRHQTGKVFPSAFVCRAREKKAQMKLNSSPINHRFLPSSLVWCLPEGKGRTSGSKRGSRAALQSLAGGDAAQHRGGCLSIRQLSCAELSAGPLKWGNGRARIIRAQSSFVTRDPALTPSTSEYRDQ